MTWEFWAPIAVAVVMAVPGILSWFSGRNKDEAEATDKIADAAGKMVERQSKQFEAMEARCNNRIVVVEEKLQVIECENESLRDANERARGRSRELLAENKQIKLELEMLRAENHELWRGVMTAIGQLNEAEMVPHWEPTAKILRRYGMNNQERS